MSVYKFVSGDTGSTLRIRALNIDGTVIDLTNRGVQIVWVTAGIETIQSMTILNPVLGTAEYMFQAGELVSPFMSFEIRINDSSGRHITSLQLIDIPVRESLP